MSILVHLGSDPDDWMYVELIGIPGNTLPVQSSDDDADTTLLSMACCCFVGGGIHLLKRLFRSDYPTVESLSSIRL